MVTGFQTNRIYAMKNPQPHRHHRHHHYRHHHHLYYRRQQSIGLHNSEDDNENDNNDSISPPVDTMRTMLESSWNTIKMGRVPVDADAAAKEAFLSIMRASVGATIVDSDDNIKEEDDMAGIFFVDLLLPSYDIKQVQAGQTNLYDEVAAVEYCISLANCFKGKTEIIVRDDKTLQTVTNVLNARERNKNIRDENNVDVVLDEDGDNDSIIEDDDSNNISEDDSMDIFRQKMISNWDESTIINFDKNGPENQSNIDVDSSSISSSSTTQPISKDSLIKTSSASPLSNKKSYRLASLFGNTRINPGPDMASRVIQAVRNNALAEDDEDNIVILSAIGSDEMVAVRALVTKYGNEKRIIFVNCQFQPTPRELLSAETVYSVLPLMAKKNNNQNKDDDNNNIAPKVVVLRRFPKDWEIFVDIGNGYELAETVAANGSNKRGLSMELIARGVVRHLDFVSRR